MKAASGSNEPIHASRLLYLGLAFSVAADNTPSIARDRKAVVLSA
jgi:hypothetical protein